MNEDRILLIDVYGRGGIFERLDALEALDDQPGLLEAAKMALQSLRHAQEGLTVLDGPYPAYFATIACLEKAIGER